MYDLKKLADYLEENNFGTKGTSLWIGRFDMETLENGIMLSQDVPVGATDTTFSSIVGYDKDIVKVLYLGNKSYTSTADKITDLYEHFKANKAISTKGIIQVIPDKPNLIEKIKNKYLFVMLLNITYKRGA